MISLCVQGTSKRRARTGMSRKGVTGHQPRAVFDRYNIVGQSDLIETSRLVEDGRAVEFGLILGVVTLNNTSPNSSTDYIINIMRKWRNWQTHQI
jgi:hypothetical protein